MQSLGKLNVSELFFEVPKNYSKAQDGSLRLFARSVKRFEKPVDISKKEIKQPPWRTHLSTYMVWCTIDLWLLYSPLSAGYVVCHALPL